MRPPRLRLCAILCALLHAHALLLTASPTVSVYTSDVCLGHDPGWLSMESPRRLASLLSSVRSEWPSEFGERLRVHEPDADATEEQLLRVHSPAHLQRVGAACEKAGSSFLQPRVALDADTVVSVGSRAASLRAAGLVVAAVDEVFSAAEGTARRAFCLVRPPGHHAEPDQPMGFCLYNNAMVGVAHAQACHGVGRVAVLDFDVHHGNGCAAACWSDVTRLYASTHQRGLFPSGVSRFTPEGNGRAGAHGQILSRALAAGAGSAEFRAAWEQLLHAVADFAPEAVFLASGFDGHAREEVASLALQDDDYAWLSAEAARLGGGALPLVSVLEGGYNSEVLARTARAHVRALIRGADPGADRSYV